MSTAYEGLARIHWRSADQSSGHGTPNEWGGISSEVPPLAYPGGMVKARLHDDDFNSAVPASSLSVRQAVEGDRSNLTVDPYPPMDSTFPTLTIRQPQKSGYDDDGNPTWTWVTVLEGPASYFEELSLLGATGGATGPARRLGRLGRFQTDAEAGKSVIFAQATMYFPDNYEGEAITESAKVYHENGTRYSVTRVITHPDAIDLELARPSQNG